MRKFTYHLDLRRTRSARYLVSVLEQTPPVGVDFLYAAIVHTSQRNMSVPPEEIPEREDSTHIDILLNAIDYKESMFDIQYDIYENCEIC